MKHFYILNVGNKGGLEVYKQGEEVKVLNRIGECSKPSELKNDPHGIIRNFLEGNNPDAVFPKTSGIRQIQIAGFAIYLSGNTVS